MPNKKISQLVNKTTILSTDLFPIGDATSGQLYKKTIAELQAAIGGAVISVNGLVGTVVLDTDDIQELVSPTNKWFTDARARGAVSATSPLAYNSSTGVFSIPAATTSANGYLTSTDWNTFNGKENVLTFSSPLVRTSNTISIPAATTSVNGYLTSTDWNTFNNKQGALTLTTTGSSGSATLASNTLNIPTYTLAGLGGITASFLSGGTGITYNSGTGVIATTITQYTDALARASLSFTAGSGAYNSTTGVITIPTNTSQLTNGANFITLASLSGGTGITYNSTTGAISYSGTVYTDSSIRGLFSGSTGISYNSTTGAISSTITQYTDALARGAISLTTTGSSGASTYNSTTGVLNIPNYGSALSGYLPLTGGTLTGALGGTSASFSGSVSGSSITDGYITISAAQINRPATVEMQYSAGGNVRFFGNTSYPITFTAGSGTVSFSSDLTLSSTGNSFIVLNNTTATTGKQWRTSSASNGNFYITQVGVVDVLTLAPTTGAATFSSSVTAGGNILVSGTTNGYAYQNFGANSVYGWQIGKADNSAGIAPSNGFYIYDIANSATRFVISQSGSVGIGTSSPSYTLDVNGTGRFSGNVAINGSASSLDINPTTGQPNITLRSGNTFRGYIEGNSSGGMSFGTGAGASICLTLASTGAATFSSSVTASGSKSQFVASGGSSSGAGISLNTGLSGTDRRNWFIGTEENIAGDFVIKSSDTAGGNANSGTTRLAILNSGSVGIGTSSPAYKLDVSGEIRANNLFRSTDGTNIGLFGSSVFASNVIGIGSSNNVPLVFGTNATEQGRITAGGNWLLGTTTDNGERLYISGNVRATGTITANSDIRLKKNLERIENALEKVGQISGYTYDTIYDDRRHGGVIAQEIDEVFPEIVNKGNDGLLGVEYGNISALLIEALKEATTKIKALESKVEALQK
jgi:hypothetical protein